MKNAIIVLNFQSYELTYKCVKQILSLKLPDAFIIILDNCSKDKSFEFLLNSFSGLNNVFVLRTDLNLGYAKGNNYGVERALEIDPTVDYFTIINPDVMIMQKDFFSLIENSFACFPDAVLASGIMYTNGSITSTSYGWNLPRASEIIFCGPFKKKHIEKKPISEQFVFPECLSGSCFCIRKDFVTNFGLFDQGTFLYNEENLLGLRISKYNYKEVLNTDCCFEHNHVYLKKTNKFEYKKRISFVNNWFRGRFILFKEMKLCFLLKPFLIFTYVFSLLYSISLETFLSFKMLFRKRSY